MQIDHAALVVIERLKCRIGTVHEVCLSDITLFVHVVVVKIRDFEQPVDFRQLGEFLPCQLAIVIAVGFLEERGRVAPPFLAGDLAVVIEVPGGFGRHDE